MSDEAAVCVSSEIGELESVVLHRPGPEVENMTPENAQKALYSDILNLPLVIEEYDPFYQALGKLTRVYEVRDLLRDVLANEKVKEALLQQVCRNENAADLLPELQAASAEELSDLLIQGVLERKNTLTRFLSKERYALKPLHNFFFTRDAAVAINDQVLISPMANRIRERESMIMEAIFGYHPLFCAKTFKPEAKTSNQAPISIEGGDILVARDDILLVGQGSRTTTQGIDYLIEHFKAQKQRQHIIVKELPFKPESFIHLDMVFTFLDVDTCMVFSPLILEASRFLTILITIDNGKVMIREEDSLLGALKKLGMELKAVSCGGSGENYIQQREQWHSGANFFCLGPGRVIGYGRNLHTIEALSQNGFTIIPADDVVAGRSDPRQSSKYVITIQGAELSRGGGGCRCMTLPVKRKAVTI